MMYKYATGNCIEEIQTYFYTEYKGMPFLDAWKDSRKKILNSHTIPKSFSQESFHLLENDSSILSVNDILDILLSNDKYVNTKDIIKTLYLSMETKKDQHIIILLKNLLKRFEITKRVHDVYGKNYKPKDIELYKNLELYICLAEIFEKAYSIFNDLPYLNALLKIIDSISSVFASLNNEEKSRLCFLVENEYHHVNQLANSIGVIL